MTGPLRYQLLDRALLAGFMPDALLRAGALMSTTRRAQRLSRGGASAVDAATATMVRRMRTGPIAEVPAMANEQHYELPAEFFGLFLGPWRKYSCCYWADDASELQGAEEAMLDLTCRRAAIEPGMTVLDLGCGWGALSMWLAEREGVRVLAVSNSHAQRVWIESECERRSIGDRVTVVTCDINEFDPGRRFDRVVSVEMFEHLRNWAELLRRVSTWLNEEGRAFVHAFSHCDLAYEFKGSWAAERFFTAGIMPSHDLLLRFDDHMVVTERWAVSGDHYSRTLGCWLERLDENQDDALNVLSHHVRLPEARRLLAAWRLFLLGTSAMWGSHNGSAWMVSHYLLERRGRPGIRPGVRDL